jgi:hypothetical protein
MVACFISVTLFLRTAHGGVTVCVSSSGGNGTHSVPLRLPRKGGPLGQGLGAWLLRGVVSGPERRTGNSMIRAVALFTHSTDRPVGTVTPFTLK